MFKLFKKEITSDEEWLSILKKDGVNLTKIEIQKARQNDGQTLFNIACDYYKNKKDHTKAFPWFYKAALENYRNAQNHVGYMYQRGQGVSQDYTLAMEWYKKAAPNGSTYAQYNIGSLYRDGQGVTQDYKLAMKWYQKAASNGNASAQNAVGYLYQHGLGVSQDYKVAMEWFQKAAKNGNFMAQKNIGYMYYYGLGVPQDYKEAMEWYQKAASSGNSYAQCTVGEMYENGHSVPKSVDIAIEWYQKAADNNNEKAKVALARLNKEGNTAKEGHKDEESINIDNSKNCNTVNIIKNEQTQPSSSASSNDDHINKLIDDKMKSMQEAFQLKLGLIENEKNAALSHLKQEQTRKEEENKQLKEKLAKLEAELKQVAALNYDSPKDNGNNDINYDSTDDGDDANNDINYDTECSDNEENTNHNTSKAVHQNPNKSVVNEVYADPNYDSSDNEDRTNDICLD